MSVSWTEEQKKVIDARNSDLLVSAAAGSGKTAVLIERIIGLILDENDPVDLDELLVVTFTRAAAAEMSTRIADRLSKMLSEETAVHPDSALAERLSEQYALLPHAQISTIDSFAKRVVMEHFEEGDIDPGVRIADENELAIIKNDVMAELLLDKYEEGSSSFLDFTEYFASGRDDSKIEDIIGTLVRFSEGFPDPKRWLRERKEEYAKGLCELPSVNILSELVRKILESCASAAERAYELSMKPFGPNHYASVLLDESETFKRMSDINDIDRLYSELSEYKFRALPRAKKKDENGNPVEIDSELQDKVKGIREGYKKNINDVLLKKFIVAPIGDSNDEFKITIPPVIEALTLAEEFRERYKKAKEKKDLVDFSDLEHLALNILRNPDGSITDAAKSYRKQYRAVMTDEYQDSNILQESILTAVAGSDEGNHDMFMVGDVKQSIYKFRQARSELFIEKYRKYKEDGQERRIDLHKNFRSREEVIDSVNAVFRDIMHESFGGIEYDKNAELVCGRSDIKDDGRDHRTEFIFSDKDLVSDDEEMAREISLLDNPDYEARLIAARIRKLHDEEKWKYSDIVVLFRSMKGWAEVVKRVLLAEGIPAVSETTAGYFNAWEVQTALDILAVIDNPRQDIPLSAVMLSPVGNFTVDELAELRVNGGRKKDLWELLYSSDNEKAIKFCEKLNEMRKLSLFLPVHELIRRIFADTNFIDHVAAMPGGAVRKGNLALLAEKARAFETAGLHGLVHFNRYIKKIRDEGIDFGEADPSEALDAVRIMSIHKSKGLQFPVVFVSGLGKKINRQDSKDAVIMHPDYGIGVDCFKRDTREKWPSLPKLVIAEKMNSDAAAEEERLLYVAMTRAEDKLILTATGKGDTKKFTAFKERQYDAFALSHAESVLDMIFPTLLRDKEHFNMIEVKPETIIEEEKHYLSQRGDITMDDTEGEASDPSLAEKIEQEINFIYPYEDSVGKKYKFTVSEIKKLHLLEEEAGVIFAPSESEDESDVYVPDFAKEEAGPEGADRGTLIHNIMRHIDLKRSYTEKDLAQLFDALVEKGKLTKDERSALNTGEFLSFLDTDIAREMAAADREGFLFREQPFVMTKDDEGNDPILVQGIIDAWYENEDGIIILDYKTDRVRRADGENILRERYSVQLDLYAEAVKKATGKTPIHKYIYSFTLGKVIECD